MASIDILADTSHQHITFPSDLLGKQNVAFRSFRINGLKEVAVSYAIRSLRIVSFAIRAEMKASYVCNKKDQAFLGSNSCATR